MTKNYWNFDANRWEPDTRYGTGTFSPSLARRAAKDNDAGGIEYTIVQDQKFYQVTKVVE